MNQTTSNALASVAAASGTATAVNNETGFLDVISANATEIGLGFTALTCLAFLSGSAYNAVLSSRRDKREERESAARIANIENLSKPSSSSESS